MNSYVLSNEADVDIEEITRESAKRWGFGRASRYILELHAAFETLAEFPHLGRDAGHLREGYFRLEHDRHSVFYRNTDDGVLIIRILHARQQPENICSLAETDVPTTCYETQELCTVRIFSAARRFAGFVPFRHLRSIAVQQNEVKCESTHHNKHDTRRRG